MVKSFAANCLLSPTAVEYVPVLILHLSILGYLLSLKGKSNPTWLFTGWIACMTLVMASMFASYVIYAPLGGYVHWFGGIVSGTLALVFFLQFTYRFPRPRYAREAQVVLVVSVAIVVGMLALMAFETIHTQPPQPLYVAPFLNGTQSFYADQDRAIPAESAKVIPIYHFEQFYFGFANPTNEPWWGSPTLFDTWQAVGYLWALVVWLRKTVQFSAVEPGRQRWWQRVMRVLYRPQGKEAQATRAWSLVVLLASLPIIAAILEPTGMLPPGSLTIADLAAMSFACLAWINYSREPTTFMVKLVGISLVILLMILGLINIYILGLHREAYEQARQIELEHIKAWVETDHMGKIPGPVLYIATRPVAGGLFVDDHTLPPEQESSSYRLLFSRMEGLNAYALAAQDTYLKAGLEAGYESAREAVMSEHPWLGGRIEHAGSGGILAISEGKRSYRGAHFVPSQHIIRYTFAAQDWLYEVGYSYFDYRHLLHIEALPLLYLIFGATGLILFIFPLFFRASLIQPLESLLDGVKRVDRGDLTVTVPARVEDEIGFLTGAFNRMVHSLQASQASLRSEITERERAEAEVRALSATLEQRVIDRTHELSALYQVSAVASQAHNLETLLVESLSQIMLTIPCEASAVYLLGGEDEPEPPVLRLAAHQAIDPDLLPQVEAVLAGRDTSAWVVEQREPLLIPDLSADSRLCRFGVLRQLDPLALLLAPLQAGGQVLGTCVLARRLGKNFSAEEIALLASIADQVGVAVESERLRQQVRQAVVLQERQRVARDLHDMATQSLYGLVTLTEAGQAQIESLVPGQATWDTVGHTFARIGYMARQALKEMRLFLHQLRLPELEQEGLVNALHLRLAAVEGRSNVQARLLADKDIHLAKDVEQALYYIAQEALNNALRHANASSVTVYLKCEDENVILQVVDDGCGFETGVVGIGGMGLANMQERTEGIGGTLRIVSRPGEGTKVEVVVGNLQGRLRTKE
jgi:signal transduction histidine kinase/HAMP domain-containing protein